MEELDIMIDAFPDLNIQREVYVLSKQGSCQPLKSLLLQYSVPERKSVVNNLYEDEGQSCTPLIIASKKGHLDVVKFLLNSEELGCEVDKECEGKVKFEGHPIEGATALWCASGAGWYDVVEELIRKGALIDHETKNKSTPLRAACFEGRLNIVNILCEHGADLDKSNKYNNTCLMISSYNSHQDVVSYLLNSGADPNLKALCGATACHFAAEKGNIFIVDSLLNHGAEMTANKHGMTPLLCAAERCQAMMVEHLIQRPEISKEMAIEALELLGASFANDNSQYDIGLSLEYLRRAMNMRWTPPVIEKKSLVTTEAYDNRCECKTVMELEQISTNPDAIHMEGLCIRERVMGQDNPELPYIIIFRGAIFADSLRFDRCTALWLHALFLRRDTGVSVAKDILRFAQMFSQMYTTGHEISFDQVAKVLSVIVSELEINISKLKELDKEEADIVKEEIKQNMLSALYFIKICLSVEKRTGNMPDQIYKEIYKLVQVDPRTCCGSSLLHLAVDQQTPVDEFHTNDVVKFPCYSTTKLLLKSGADAQSMDERRNTPLHIIVTYRRVVEDFLTLHSIIVSLLEAGAHIDSVNSAGQTTLAAATSGVAEIILKSQSKMSLKCIAAQSVRKYNLTYQGQVPQSLESFIQIHGP